MNAYRTPHTPYQGVPMSDDRNDTVYVRVSQAQVLKALATSKAADEQQAFADLVRPPAFCKDVHWRMFHENEEANAKAERRKASRLLDQTADDILRKAGFTKLTN